jgi:hypothetical protein
VCVSGSVWWTKPGPAGAGTLNINLLVECKTCKQVTSRREKVCHHIIMHMY